MLLTYLIGAAALLAPLQQQQLDTTVQVSSGTRVEIENLAGEVVVRTWDRSAVRVVASGNGASGSAVRLTGAVLRIESDARRIGTRSVDYQITMPASAGLRVSGPYNDVRIEGAGGDVAVETVRGNVSVRGGNGEITLRTVQGSIDLEQARGRLRVGSVNERIRISNSSGEITAETVNGAITLQGIESASVEASTVNGSLAYDGTLRDGGRYAFATHNGSITLGVPEQANATVSVTSFDGQIDSEIPIAISEVRRGRRFTFSLGTGSARVDLESFNGTIRLRRPGGASTREE